MKEIYDFASNWRRRSINVNVVTFHYDAYGTDGFHLPLDAADAKRIA